MSKIPIEKLLAHPGALILGAPGSGKTTLLIELVSELEKQGFGANEILVLTPSRTAASQLRDQISIRSSLAATEPRARSISSFAFAVLSKLNPKLKLISGAQQQALIAKLISDALAQGAHLRWGVEKTTARLSGFQQELRDLLSVLIENRVDLLQLEGLARNFETKGLKVALDIYPRYLQAAKELDAIDPSELLVLAAQELAEVELPKVLLIDDAQDLSEAGLQLVEKLAADCMTFVFGDPDASVLGFRSAGESFVGRFQNLAKHSIQVNYLNPARASLMPKIAVRIPSGLGIDHRPKRAASEQIAAEIFDTTSEESDWLAANLRKARLVDKLSFDQMAVVARTRVQLDQLARDLTSRNVPVRILGVQQPLRNQPIALSILEFGALTFGIGSVDRHRLLSSPIVGLDALGVRRLLRELALRPEFPSGLSELKSELFEGFIESESLEVRRLNAVTELRFKLAAKAQLSAYEFVSAALELVPLRQLETLSRGRGSVALAANRELDAALELVAAAQRFDLRGWGNASDFILQQLELAIPEDSLAPVGLRPAVTLATSSQLAGQSFKLVALPRLQEGIWPNLKPRNALLGASALQAFLLGRLSSPKLHTRAELQDELRLFYKAVGSATQSLLLSAVSGAEESPSQFLTMFDIAPQSNVFGMDFDIRRQVGKLRRRAIEKDPYALSMLATLALAGVPGAHPKNWQGLLELSTQLPIVENSEAIRINASKLEAFEKCPLHWFVETFSGETGSFQASLGTLLHAAMEAAASGADPAEYVQSNWHTLEFESQWHSMAQLRRSSKMVTMLSQYLSASNPLEAAEQAFELNLGKLSVTGKIDRIERSDQGLVVVDLKTGKPPTKEEVAKNRQLALYQLALQNQGHAVEKAQIVSIGGDSLRVIEQPALGAELRAELTELLERASDQVGAAEFVAAISSHCSDDANCQLLIAKTVQHG